MGSILQALFIGLNRITDDASNKYHEIDGWISYVIIFSKIICCMYFKYMVEIIYVGGEKINKFVKTLKLIGMVYFLHLPILLLFSFFIQYIDRNFFIIISYHSF